MPLFSSQYTGSPLGIMALARVSQYCVPLISATLRFDTVIRSMSKPNSFTERNLSCRLLPLAVPEPRMVPHPPWGLEHGPVLRIQSTEVVLSPGSSRAPNAKPLTDVPPAT